VVQEGSAEDAVIDPMTDECVKLFPRNDAKLGACVVRGLLSVRPALVARWERGLGSVSRDQTAACKQVIHAYWLAARKNIRATTLYFEAHRHTGSTRIQAEAELPALHDARVAEGRGQDARRRRLRVGAREVRRARGEF
jgi:hypothetical protein